MMKQVLINLAALIAGLGLLAACGGGGEEEAPKAAAPGGTGPGGRWKSCGWGSKAPIRRSALWIKTADSAVLILISPMPCAPI